MRTFVYSFIGAIVLMTVADCCAVLRKKDKSEEFCKVWLQKSWEFHAVSPGWTIGCVLFLEDR